MMCSLYTLVVIIIVASANVSGYFWIEEGGLCSKRNGEKGICTHFTKCEPAIEEVRKNGRPEICSFSGKYPIVCCPTSNSPSGQDLNWQQKIGDDNGNQSYYLSLNSHSKSHSICRKYYTKPFEQDEYLKRGSTIKHYPHIALLGFPNKNRAAWICTGALISENFVLTTAHCIHSRLYGDLKYIRLGGFESSISNGNSQHQSFTVKNIHIHHKYQPSSGYYDIALIELNKPATFTEYVKPACLAVTEDLYGTLPELTGIEHKEDDNKLVIYYYTFVSNGYCKKKYGGLNFIKEGIKSSQICATSEHSLEVEAGGPLQITNFFYEFGNFPEIVGLSSFGKPDEDAPDVFTRVYSYVPWIESIVWPN